MQKTRNMRCGHFDGFADVNNWNAETYIHADTSCNQYNMKHPSFLLLLLVVVMMRTQSLPAAIQVRLQSPFWLVFYHCFCYSGES
jgi:hypothetical protein